MNILSVDFDFFSDVTTNQLSLFPDGTDVSPDLSEIIWAGYYAQKEDELNSIDIMHSEFEALKNKLLSLDKDIPVMITDSHIHIYEFLKRVYPQTEAGLNVVNIDMHHDYKNDNPDLDCGNWLSYVEKDFSEKGFSFSWITNPVSLKEVCGENYFEKGGKYEKAVLSSVDCISDMDFNAVFLCRSGTWTPPHLDKYFVELCDIIKKHFFVVWGEKGIDVPRTQYLALAEQERTFLKGLKKGV